MIRLSADVVATLRPWFLPEHPAYHVGLHVIQTGNGTCWVDRWPDPRAVLAETAGNYTLIGQPQALTPDSLRPHIVGFVDAPTSFEPLLRATFPDLQVWDRVVYVLTTTPRFARPQKGRVCQLMPADADHLERMDPDMNWIAKTWGGSVGLAASGYAWGAFIDDRVVALACTAFLGERYEELGIVTEAEFRGLGLSGACAGALCQDIQRRGREPSWSTSPDNTASMRVAEKLGFTLQHSDRLYVTGVPIPQPAQRPT